VIGCGRQAASHVIALREALPSLDRVVVFAPNKDRVAAFCAQHGCEPVEDSREAGECDVVVTVTTAKDPVLRGEWLRPGALVLAIGANDPASRELDAVVLDRASFVSTDSREQAQEEAGDLIDAVERGALDWADIHELPNILTGDVAARANDDDIAVFKSNGLAAWDLAVAARVVELLTS
jgi:ornithine cyclodeaminase/alanine dehydrogenase-like protein (mu-crystallin family)